MKTLFILCLYTALLFSLSSCNEHLEGLDTTEATDDATLLASQLKLLQTRATDATNTILISTAKSVHFTVEKTGSLIVDWGDGIKEIDNFSHTYTDNLPVHTILFYGTQDVVTSISAVNQELIFLDVTKNSNLKRLTAVKNRLTLIDVSQNINLEKLYCFDNSLLELQLTENVNLKKIVCTNNKISVLNLPEEDNKLEELICENNSLNILFVKHTPKLKRLRCSNNELRLIDLRNIPELTDLICSNNSLPKLNIPANNKLQLIECSENQIDSLDLSWCNQLQQVSCANNQIVNVKLPTTLELYKINCQNNPLENDNTVLILAGLLPNRSGKTPGTINFSNAVTQNTDWELINTLCSNKNWTLLTE